MYLILWFIIKSLIGYMSFILLSIGWCMDYIYARTWALTWGGRPAPPIPRVWDSISQAWN